MSFLLNYIKGFFIGIGAILPGISSGVLCVVFGIYEDLINSVLGFFQNIKKNFIYLAPILLGVGTGVILFGTILLYLFENYTMQTSFTFIGLILGSLPTLFKQANKGKVVSFKDILFLILAILFTIFLLFIEKHVHFIPTLSNINFMYFILAGFLMSIGVVIPGVSSSVILMLLGVYEIYLFSISNVDLSILFPMGIGLMIGGILFLKMIQYLFKNHYSKTYYSIIGFVIGSIFVLYPGFQFTIEGVSSFLLLVFSFVITHKLENINKNK